MGSDQYRWRLVMTENTLKAKQFTYATLLLALDREIYRYDNDPQKTLDKDIEKELTDMRLSVFNKLK